VKDPQKWCWQEFVRSKNNIEVSSSVTDCTDDSKVIFLLVSLHVLSGMEKKGLEKSYQIRNIRVWMIHVLIWQWIHDWEQFIQPCSFNDLHHSAKATRGLQPVL
jgi:hypothetical protein